MRSLFALAMLSFSTAVAAPADDLTLTTTPFVRGYDATLSVSGSAANRPVYLGYSLAGLNPGGVCPPPLAGECLDLVGPQLVPVQPRADANGDAELTFTVPGFLSDMHMQAATLAPTQEVSEAIEVAVYDANPAGTLDDHIDSITGASITLNLDIGLDDSATTCTLFGICSCTAVYEATGGSPVRSGQALTFDGTWAQDATASTCNPVLSQFIWTPSGGNSFHTIYFGPHSTSLDLWVAHSGAGNAAPISDDILDQFNGEQFVVGVDPVVPFLGYSDVAVEGLVEVAVDVLGIALDVSIAADADITFTGLPAN